MEDIRTRISGFYKSFSGTDTLAFILIPGCAPVWLGSLTTISYSMYRNKRPVINIGRTNINGVTRGSRIFAGTMIFTLINQHWLREIQEQENTKWLGNFKELKVDELPLFDIIIVSANEYGNAVDMLIYGIDFTDEAQTISVEDLFTENTFSFIARDITTFQAINTLSYTVEKHAAPEDNKKEGQNYYIIDHSESTFEEISRLEEEYKKSVIQNNNQTKIYRLNRELYYPTSQPFMGNDVIEIQQLLNATSMFKLAINGIYNQETAQAVREYQHSAGLPATGVMNDKTYNALLNNVIKPDTERLAVVVNKYGAYIYSRPSLLSDIVGTIPYQTQIAVLGMVTQTENGVTRKWYQIEQGYIVIEDMYSSYYQGGVLEFPVLQYGDTNAYVTLIQTALSKLYPTFTTINGTFDYATQIAIKRFQAEYGLPDTGIVDYQTWLLLEQYSNSILHQTSDDSFNITMSRDPGTYVLSQNAVLSELAKFNIIMSSSSYLNVKMTATCIFNNSDGTQNKSTIHVHNVTIKNPASFNFKTIFHNAFVYDVNFGKVPDAIDIIVYPYNKVPYKWSFKYS